MTTTITAADDSGPYDTERQARAAAHTVITPPPGSSILSTAQNRHLIRRALEAAGVTTGAYDDRIAEWLGQWEDSVVSVIAGWVTRASRTAVLIDDDRKMIDRARGLAAARDIAGLRSWFSWRGDEITSRADASYLYGAALGAAQKYLADLLDTIDRITGHPYPAPAGRTVPLMRPAIAALLGADPASLPLPDDGTLTDAIADAIAYRAGHRDFTPGDCGDCAYDDNDEIDSLCPDHEADEARAARYEQLLALLRPAQPSDTDGQ